MYPEIKNHWYRHLLHPSPGLRLKAYTETQRWDLAAEDSDQFNINRAIQYGGREIRNKFINHPDYIHRAQVARHGTDKEHRQLMYDPDQTVRHAVATYTFDKDILNHLSNDSESYISYAARTRLRFIE